MDGLSKHGPLILAGAVALGLYLRSRGEEEAAEGPPDDGRRQSERDAYEARVERQHRRVSETEAARTVCAQGPDAIEPKVERWGCPVQLVGEMPALYTNILDSNGNLYTPDAGGGYRGHQWGRGDVSAEQLRRRGITPGSYIFPLATGRDGWWYMPRIANAEWVARFGHMDRFDVVPVWGMTDRFFVLARPDVESYAGSGHISDAGPTAGGATVAYRGRRGYAARGNRCTPKLGRYLWLGPSIWRTSHYPSRTSYEDPLGGWMSNGHGPYVTCHERAQIEGRSVSTADVVAAAQRAGGVIGGGMFHIMGDE